MSPLKAVIYIGEDIEIPVGHLLTATIIIKKGTLGFIQGKGKNEDYQKVRFPWHDNFSIECDVFIGDYRTATDPNPDKIEYPLPEPKEDNGRPES